jgi:hypothetical protein
MIMIVESIVVTGGTRFLSTHITVRLLFHD